MSLKDLYDSLMTTKVAKNDVARELSPGHRALAKLAEEGAIEWGGGKPKGLRGLVARGEPVSETIIRERG
jgi:hypothetical protein